MKVKYHLKDEGQDLVSLTITDDTITAVDLDSENHRRLYVGKLWYDFYTQQDPKPLPVGKLIRFSASPRHSVATLRFPVARVEVLA